MPGRRNCTLRLQLCNYSPAPASDMIWCAQLTQPYFIPCCVWHIASQTAEYALLGQKIQTVLLACSSWYNRFSKCWADCFNPVRSAVPLASDITKTLIKLLCSFWHCRLCDSPPCGELIRGLCRWRLRHLLTAQAAFSRVEKVRSDGGIWLF